MFIFCVLPSARVVAQTVSLENDLLKVYYVQGGKFAEDRAIVSADYWRPDPQFYDYYTIDFRAELKVSNSLIDNSFDAEVVLPPGPTPYFDVVFRIRSNTPWPMDVWQAGSAWIDAVAGVEIPDCDRSRPEADCTDYVYLVSYDPDRGKISTEFLRCEGYGGQCNFFWPPPPFTGPVIHRMPPDGA